MSSSPQTLFRTLSSPLAAQTDKSYSGGEYFSAVFSICRIYKISVKKIDRKSTCVLLTNRRFCNKIIMCDCKFERSPERKENREKDGSLMKKILSLMIAAAAAFTMSTAVFAEAENTDDAAAATISFDTDKSPQ